MDVFGVWWRAKGKVDQAGCVGSALDHKFGLTREYYPCLGGCRYFQCRDPVPGFDSRRVLRLRP